MKAKVLRSKSLTRSLGLNKHFALALTNSDKRHQLSRAKWDTFVSLAVIRFKKWWDIFPEILRETNEGKAKPEMTLKTLPPLDVLMIWITQLFSPDNYRNMCQDSIKEWEVSSMEFPWDLLHAIIDPYDSTYHLSPEAQDYFHQKTGHPADLYAHLTDVKEHDRLSRTYLQRFALSQLPKAKKFNTRELDARPSDFSQLMRDYAMWNFAIKTLKPVVQSQETFWEKMGQSGWLRGPCPAFTLTRAISRYNQFLQLRKIHPNSGELLPTPLIELAWRTHQCSPTRYAFATQEIAGRFINYDEGMAKYAAMTGGFAKAEKLYKAEFGQDYDPCMCWNCEAELAEKQAVDSNDEENSRRAEARVTRALEVERARKAGKIVRV
ncbi:hypothetical protein GTA08_BOTSDO11239 [Neofusicoccum parvum]|uniref:Uncharacterized protein n=2 Tax=Neofusicoccum parvum TaxID=310453 RepID=R1GBE6_BOTPV|nr:hypothetical protein UCRNP2_10096 [Neofusicoccum parvum UCRNP2]GME28475.1 hypothetical protein GTA08_BOTSDO11239 [Neofusicoccum parvum]GME32745.1 hypothetical protein GTA08_BOTSDO11239 [Neofusicoccum parvum]